MARPLPPPAPLGERLAAVFDVQFEDRRRRNRDEVLDLAGRWVTRYARRAFSGYRTEGWSGSIEPGRTYLGWWFGWIEVYLVREEAS